MPQAIDSLSCYNTRFVERCLQDYLLDPSSVSESWRKWFRELDGAELLAPQPRPSHRRRSVFNPAAVNGAHARQHSESVRLQARVDQLIRAYRVRGHLATKLDPLGMPRPEPPELLLETHGLNERDLDRQCSPLTAVDEETHTLGEIVERLHQTYCQHIGVQFMHIDDLEIRDWLVERMESSGNRIELSRDEQLRILTRLTDAVIFEEFVRKKYVGSKTFSLEGAESLIPLLDLAIEKAGRQDIDEIVFGMAHRGRLNVLANIIGKRPLEIFWEFNDRRPDLKRGKGDVMYHLGYSGDWKTQTGKQIHLSLCFNPSHLEFVNPVALGRMRAKQTRADIGRRAAERETGSQSDCRNGSRDASHKRDAAPFPRPAPRGMVMLIHGDAAFAGEGIVQESFNLSQLDGYATGGTLHVIVNNQLGFTTSPDEGRSTTYPSDIARLLQIPIFHVNGEHPEAVAQAVELAMDFRAEFHCDAVVNMYCYRRWGHNEGDEPSFTQPLMYQAIEHRESVRDDYLEHLLELGTKTGADFQGRSGPQRAAHAQDKQDPSPSSGITRDEADQIAKEEREELRRQFRRAKEEEYQPANQWLSGVWQGFAGGEEPGDNDPDTGVEPDVLSNLLRKLTETPDGFHVHKKLKRSIEQRRKMAAGEKPLDWSTAEALAIATLAVEGYPVRLSGQDTARGTFSQRHAVLYDVVDGRRYEIFQRLSDQQAPVEVINSPLCEAAALGFEYGFSLDYPEALVAWEAQYGDFANAAQVIIDQFLASAEDKWRRLSGLVMLCPHGFEGQGPEHSSARLERFLSLAAEDNLQVACPSSPAQYFHLLRRQVKRRWRKPLIVLTPKSLLRHPRAVSSLEELATGRFSRLLPDVQNGADNRNQDDPTGAGHPRDRSTVSRILLCSGKVYYDLLKHREEHEISNAAILRIEQFYPLRDEVLSDALTPFADKTPVVWVQEEPENMGAWRFWQVKYGMSIGQHSLSVVARPPSASPATGSKASHKREQEELIVRAFENEMK